jgi:prepilin-type N-terminal cleavage/methylation domain-containing protein
MKKAFSLIELLIVVLIVGIVYTMAISGFDNLKKGKAKPTLLNLKSYLSKIEYKKDVRLICLDACESCLLIVDGKIKPELSEQFDGFLDKDVRVYTFNINTALQNLPDAIYFNSEGTSEDICFSFSIDKKGVSTQVIVEYKDYVYDFTSYLAKTKKYTSTSDFIDAKQKVINEVLN